MHIPHPIIQPSLLEEHPEVERVHLRPIHHLLLILAHQLADLALRRFLDLLDDCLLYTSPSPRDLSTSRMPSSA